MAVFPKILRAFVLSLLAGVVLVYPAKALPVSNATETAVSEQVKPSIVYDPATNTIKVKGPGAIVKLSTIDSTFKDTSLLERQGSSEWLLKANLLLFEQVRLELHGTAAGGDVNWLKLLSEPDRFVSIESSNGQISIRDTRITSWDTGTSTFDVQYLDGSKRAYISAKNRRAQYTDSRMDVINSEVAYLGFFEETAYGISWKVISEPDKGDTGILGRGITGTITGSKFHHNYFGVYVWGAGDMEVRNNEIYENFYYGFDAHTVTQRTIVEDNFSHDNGGHGIIFAERCTENIIRRNRVVNNKHGIMLHEQSNNNVIEGNTVTGNDDGIPIFESSNNRIVQNEISSNTVGARIYGRASSSSKNLFEGNEISGSKSYGVFIYDEATENTFRSNRIFSNGDAGIYLKGVSDNLFSGNVIQGNQYGIRFDSADSEKLSTGNQVRDNIIENNKQFGVYSYAPANANTVGGNQFSGNSLGDASYLSQPVRSSTGTRLVDLLRIGFLAGVILVVIVSGTLIYFRSRRAKTGM